MKNGTAALFQDNSAHGEDSQVSKELTHTSCLDAVLDGVSRCEGAYASGFTAQMLQDAPIESLEDVISALEQANEVLFQGGKGRNLLTTVSIALKIDDRLHVLNAGDSPIYLIRDGEIRELTTIVKSGMFTSATTNAVGLHEGFAYESGLEVLQPQDWLILATDGLPNNILPQELLAIVEGAPSPDSVVAALRALVSEKRRLNRGRDDTFGTFREDDQTAIIRAIE